MTRHRSRTAAFLALHVPAVVAAAGLLVAVPARAASLQQVSTSAWASNLNSGPMSYITMYIYVPDNVVSNPPILVAAHYCGGSASAYFSFDSNVVALADRYGFIMIFPQTTNPASSADCWDVGSTASLTHNGGGDTQAIAEMVAYAVTQYKADATRVYAMGSSSGAMLTEALMGVYPEVFKAGAEMSGVPDGCWSDGWSAASNWGGACASGDDTMTAQAWGNLVRAQYPGYTGPRPRLWLWVGSNDTTISPVNFQQSILEWENVLGLSSTPTTTQNPGGQLGSGQLWSNACGNTVLEAWELQGGGHAPTPGTDTATSIVGYFGLNTSGPDLVDQCGDAGSGSSGSSSSGSSGSSGGSSSSGSSSSSGRSSGSSGSSSGSKESGSSSASSSAESGSTSSHTTGSTGSGGQSGSTSSGGSTPVGASGGTSSASGASSGATASGARQSGMSASSSGGNGSVAGAATSNSGCSCDVALGSNAKTAPAWASALVFGLVWRRRRRSKR